MKKIFAILGTALLAAAVLTGCSNSAGGSKDSTNNGTNPTPEQQMLSEKFNALREPTGKAFLQLGEAERNAATNTLTMNNINDAKSAIKDVKTKVEDLQNTATTYLDSKNNTSAITQVKTVCGAYLKELNEIEASLNAADTGSNKDKVNGTSKKFETANAAFNMAAPKLFPLFQ